MPSGAAQELSDNHRAIGFNEHFILSSSWTFVEGTTGAVGAHTLFSVTGDVFVNLFGICKTNMGSGGTATGEVGITGNTAGIIDQVGNLQNVTADQAIMHTDQQSGSPVVRYSFEGQSAIPEGDIILTIGSLAITAGAIDWYCLWRPISADGNIVAVTPA